MENNDFDELVDELFSALESLETQTRALSQFLKENGSVSDEKLAPYLQQAAEASGVRWRAERVRMNSLLSSALKRAEESLTQKIQAALHESKDTSQPAEEPANAPSEAAGPEKAQQATASEDPNPTDESKAPAETDADVSKTPKVA